MVSIRWGLFHSCRRLWHVPACFAELVEGSKTFSFQSWTSSYIHRALVWEKKQWQCHCFGKTPGENTTREFESTKSMLHQLYFHIGKKTTKDQLNRMVISGNSWLPKYYKHDTHTRCSISSPHPSEDPTCPDLWFIQCRTINLTHLKHV